MPNRSFNERKINHLNEKKELILQLKGINESNYVHTIVDEGMPIRKDGKVINYGISSYVGNN